MFIVYRYVLKEHVGPFLFAFAIITSMLVLNFVLQAMPYIVGKGITFRIIIEYISYNLAWIVVMVVPMSVLVSTIMAFGRMASDNEIAALKAGGVSFLSLLLPIVLATLLLTVGLVEFNDKVLPVANHKARILKKSIQRKRPTLSIEPGVFVEGIDNFSMIVDNKDVLGDVVYGVTIIDRTQKDMVRTIAAERGTIRIDEGDETMNVMLETGEIHEVNLVHPENYQRIEFSRHRVTVEVENLALKKEDESFYNDREKNIDQLMEEVRRHQTERDRRLADVVTYINADPEILRMVEPKHRQLVTRYVTKPLLLERLNLWFISLHLSKADSSRYVTQVHDSVEHRVIELVRDSMYIPVRTAALLPQAHDTLLSDSLFQTRSLRAQQVTSSLLAAGNYERLIDQLMVEVNKKYSIPMAGVIFVLLGAPLGIKARRGNLGIAGGISLFFFIVYYFCLTLGEDYADRQALNPFVAMWGINVILGGLGGLLILQTTTEKTLGLQRLVGWLGELKSRIFRR